MGTPEVAAEHDGYVRFARADPRPINPLALELFF